MLIHTCLLVVHYISVQVYLYSAVYNTYSSKQEKACFSVTSLDKNCVINVTFVCRSSAWRSPATHTLWAWGLHTWTDSRHDKRNVQQSRHANCPHVPLTTCIKVVQTWLTLYTQDLHHWYTCALHTETKIGDEESLYFMHNEQCLIIVLKSNSVKVLMWVKN